MFLERLRLIACLRSSFYRLWRQFTTHFIRKRTWDRKNAIDGADFNDVDQLSLALITRLCVIYGPDIYIQCQSFMYNLNPMSNYDIPPF